MTNKFCSHTSGALLAAALLCLLPCEARAQRTAIGTVYGAAGAVTSFSGFGGQAEAGLYNAVGLWKASLSCVGRKASVYNSSDVLQGKADYLHLGLSVDHLWRIVKNHSRTLNLYAGAGVFLGMEMIDPSNRWPSGSVFPFSSRNTFLYGIDAQMEFEWFFLRSVPNLALVTGVRLPLNFSSQIKKFNQEFSLGVKYNF